MSGRRVNRSHFAWIALVLLVCGCAGNGKTSTAEQPIIIVTAEDNGKLKRPFVFEEGSLPQGFPAPGPVGSVIVKEYPTYRRARVDAVENGVVRDPDAMFSPLFNHIKRNDIAMTIPVEMGYGDASAAAASEYQDKAESMAFLYGEPSIGRLGVDEADARVAVEDVPVMTVASIGVRGDYNETNFRKAYDALQQWIEAHADRVRVIGQARYLAYNSPFVMGFLRYGEVQLPVQVLDSTNGEGAGESIPDRAEAR